METLSLKIDDVKSVIGAVDAGYTFKGYASVFGNKDSYDDVIMAGAYADQIKAIAEGGSMPKLLMGHRHQSVPVGKITRMYEDDYGLMIEAELTKGHSVAADVRAALIHKSIEGLSIGYTLNADDYDAKEDGGRVINKVSNLMEVSIVTFPANVAAKIDLASVKSLEQVSDIKGFETMLRDELNCSHSAAKAIISKAKAVLLTEQQEVKAEEAIMAAALKLLV